MTTAMPIRVTRLPTVSICTVTSDRQDFLPLLERWVASQTYPHQLLNWIIVDDSSDRGHRYTPSANLDIPTTISFLTKKMRLGAKRNLAHTLCRGEIIVYMDDDDWYPPDRVSHAVNALQQSDALVAGSSTLPILFLPECELWIAGPYGKNHATAGTFAFKRELLNLTRYDNNSSSAEERYFLKNYTMPMVQLQPEKTILCIAHNRNTFDKRQLRQNGPSSRCKRAQQDAARPYNLDEITACYSPLISDKQANKQPPTISQQAPNIHAIIPLYNCQDYIGDCIRSIQRQRGCNFNATIIDDGSTDASWQRADAAIAGDSRFQLLRNTHNSGSLAVISNTLAQHQGGSDEVVALIDSDDQLNGNDALSIVASTYQHTNCWLTYGSFITSKGEKRGSAYELRTIRSNGFRSAPWKASHLKTFRLALWQALNDQDLRDEQGRYFRSAIDLAIMLPLLELAGDHQAHISDIIYIYNTDNPTSITRRCRADQHQSAQQVRSRQPHQPLPELPKTTGSIRVE